MNLDLDKEYNNGARVPQFPQILARWKRDAVKYRRSNNADLDLSYGEHQRQKVDYFKTETKSKDALVVFIHGGYWRMPGKEVYSHMASGLNANGIDVLVPSYQLCPKVTITDIITDLRLLCAWAWRKYERRLVVTGHSAGGHLAACMLATNWVEYDLPEDLVSNGLGISGIYDLRPLMATSLNDDLGLTETEARTASPLMWQSPVGKSFQAWVGEEESDEFVRQSKTITASWSGAGVKACTVVVPNKNHFTMIDELTDAKSPLTLQLVSMAGKTKKASND